MDLRNFIREALVQIAQGIDDASAELKDSTAIVNPANVVGTGGSSDAKVYGYLTNDRPESVRLAVQRVDFDVAVVATTGTETKGGIGILVGSIGLGGQGKSDTSSSSQSRIQFSVPMVLPASRKF
ncbi:trypco2 family protein [Rhodanobacter glycinis]|jgi:hypothetical protein|uniref:Uncharacterized protein n=1 Tax=Rhodanobacter glycinis TaxID=582702 RepID=A0A1I3ZLS4_9GAMM|nr:trypco2 family protein [Rhodanobacter glycinis]SFK45002.1 hypothetical protein SAMN05192579_1038 [Rhodanobacter glycinis]